MRAAYVFCVVLLIGLTGLPSQALESWALYDNFNALTINPNKWLGGSRRRVR